jgi:hypothetical protein
MLPQARYVTLLSYQFQGQSLAIHLTENQGGGKVILQQIFAILAVKIRIKLTGSGQFPWQAVYSICGFEPLGSITRNKNVLQFACINLH